MRSYVGVAVDSSTFDQATETLPRLELEGFREVDLGDAQVTLMLMRWAPSDDSEEDLIHQAIDRLFSEREDLA